LSYLILSNKTELWKIMTV